MARPEGRGSTTAESGIRPTMTSTVDSGRRAVRAWRDPLGRTGITARGALYVVLGVLAIQFARGKTGSEEVNQTGAFEKVAEQPFGKVLLVVLVVGLAALALWRFVQAAVGDPVEGDEVKDRAKFAGKGIIYASLTVTAAKVAADAWSGGSKNTAARNAGDQQQHHATSTVFDLPGGRFLVVVLGLVLIGMAAYHVWHHGVQASFMKRLAPPPQAAGLVEAVGRIGHAARAVVLAISGVFFLVAAAQHDPNQSKGVSGSLQQMAEHGWGRLVLWATAVGLFAFGVYCLAEARYRKHS
jgi:hypothetical protein